MAHDPFSRIGDSDAAAERRVQHLLETLDRQRPGQRQQRLHAIARIWLPLASCFRQSSPHAMPTWAALEAVARAVSPAESQAIQLAALDALRAGARALSTVAQRSGGSFSFETSAACTAALELAITSDEAVVRIAAGRLMAAFPCRAFEPSLRRALTDALWTVRWNAIVALAAIAPEPSLVAELAACRPKPAEPPHQAYLDAVEALRRSGLELEREGR